MELKQFIDIAVFTEEVSNEITDISAAMSTQTARAAYYGMMHAQAKRQAATVGLTIKSVEAMLTKNHRVALNAAAVEEAKVTGKAPLRITAEMVGAAVQTDAAYLKYAKLQIDADEIETVCRVAYDAFRTRRDMLVSLGQLTRASMQGDIRIRSATENVTDYQTRRADREAQRASVAASVSGSASE